MHKSLIALAGILGLASASDRLTAIQQPRPKRLKARPHYDPEIAAWNARVEREKAEKLKAKLQRRAERLKK